jgi:hypothetical protein
MIWPQNQAEYAKDKDKSVYFFQCRVLKEIQNNYNLAGRRRRRETGCVLIMRQGEGMAKQRDKTSRIET